MPSGYIHKKISKILIGKSCERTNKLIDYPVKIFGRNHRILFHDLISALIIGLACDGVEGTISAFLHLVVDNYSRYSKVKKILEYLL